MGPFGASFNFMIQEYKDGTLLRLYIQPGASKSCWDGVHGDRIKVRIKAPPVDGAANEELIRFIAKSLSVSKSRVQFLRGKTSRQKDIVIDLSLEETLSRIKQFIELTN